MPVKRVGNIQVDQDLDFQRKEWNIQRIGSAAMALILLAALLGLFGAKGPFASTQAGKQGDPLWVEYQRFAHLISPNQFTVHISPQQISGQKLQVILQGSLTDTYQIQQVVPQPDQVQVNGSQLIYSFNVQPSGQPVDIIYFFLPNVAGTQQSSFALPGGQSVKVWQFIYP